MSAAFGGTFGWGQFTVTGQVVKAMSDCFEGTIAVTRNGDGSVSFSGGSAIRGRLNPGSVSQNPNQPSFHPTGSDPNGNWSGTDNYGTLCHLYDTHPMWVAYRDLVLDIPDGRASVAGEPAAEMRLVFTEGHRDWSQPSALNTGNSQAAGTWPIPGGTNQSAGKITLSADGSLLTIPVVLATRSFDQVGIVYFDEIWTGTIVGVLGAPEPTTVPPALALSQSGPAGLQFNATGGTATHFNGINTAPWVEGSWVESSTARYSFTIADLSAPGARGFQAYLWLVANPTAYSTEEFSGPAHPHVVRLILESDGHGLADAALGYRVNAPNDSSSFTGRGLLGQLTSVPFAGTWTLGVTDNTKFTLTAPNGAEAHGIMAASDASFFSEKVRFYLGVNPNGAENIGCHMTVSHLGINIERAADSTALAADFTTGIPLHKDWTILGANPSGIVMMPARCSYRIEWENFCSDSSDAGMLQHFESFLDPFGEPANWGDFPRPPRLFGNGKNVVYLTQDELPSETGFFRLRLP